MRRTLVFSIVFMLGALALHAQAPDIAGLAKVKTAALIVRATTSVSCGDGSEGTCVRHDPDIIKRVSTIVDGTELWQRFLKVDQTQSWNSP
jgi:hypothetical protein